MALALGVLGHVGAAAAAVQEGRLHAWTTPAALQVHGSCAPGRTSDVIAPVSGFLIRLKLDVEQSGPLPHVTGPLPAAAQVGLPVMQVGKAPLQKRFCAASPEIYKRCQHMI